MDKMNINSIAAELNDETLEPVSGGASVTESLVCKQCGATENIFADSLLCQSCLCAKLSETDANFVIRKQKHETAPAPSADTIVCLARPQH